MKLICKASLAFKKSRPAEKVGFGENVIHSITPVPPTDTKKKTKLDDIENFPYSPAQLQEINDQLSAAYTDSLTGNHTAKASLQNAIVAWDYASGVTANYVSTLAEGDATIIRMAGFVPTKSESTPAPRPGAPLNFNATVNGTKGAIVAGSQWAVPGAKVYLYIALPDGMSISYVENTIVVTVGDKTAYMVVDTTRQTEMYNLPSGVPVNVSMIAVNAAGNGPASPSVKVIPQ